MTEDFEEELWAALAENNALKLENLLALKPDRVDRYDDHHITPLMDAADFNKDESHFEVIVTLLKNGADINRMGRYHVTPFSNLVKKANLRMVQFFLNHGAEFEYDEYSVLFPAVAKNKYVEVVQLLIDAGCDPNFYDEGTPLHAACFSKYQIIDNIKCLLKNGADINANDDKGSTPLMRATNRIGKYRLKEERIIVNKKKLIFIMEHTDFNVVYGNIHIFNYDYYDLPKKLPEYLWKWIIDHLAKLKTLNISIHPVILDAISDETKYKDYFNQCEEELLRAKNIKIRNCWITFYNLLLDGRKKLKNYAGNEDLVEALENNDYEKEFPIYGAAMEENVKKGIKRRKLFDRSTILLSDYLPIFNPTHLIIRDMLDCVLSKKNLSKFCETIETVIE